MNAHNLYGRRWLLIRLPLAILGLALGVLVWAWVYPMPPSRIVLSAGLPGGAYELFAQRYVQEFARHGVTCEVLPSAGSAQNLGRLRSEPVGADLAFVQGGFGWNSISEATSSSGNPQTLAAVDIEGLWLFSHRNDLTSMDQLRTLRVAAGPEGSGHQVLFKRLLTEQMIPLDAVQMSPLTGSAAVQALQQGALDAIFLVASPRAPMVRELIQARGVHLAALKLTAGIADRNNFLERRLLAQGSLGAGQPPQDMAILTTHTHLLASEALDPALKRLATAVAVKVHGGQGSFHRAGEYPLLQNSDFPAASEARHVLRRGLSALERNLPFWWVQMLQRLLVIGLPILVAVLLLGWLIPLWLRWRLESRISRWYGELKFIEHDLARDAIDMGGIGLNRIVGRVRFIERSVHGMALPPELARRWYLLRHHVAFVKGRVREYQGR